MMPIVIKTQLAVDYSDPKYLQDAVSCLQQGGNSWGDFLPNDSTYPLDRDEVDQWDDKDSLFRAAWADRMVRRGAPSVDDVIVQTRAWLVKELGNDWKEIQVVISW